MNYDAFSLRQVLPVLIRGDGVADTMTGFYIGRVTRQVGPDRCFFKKTRGEALSPGDYVEIGVKDKLKLFGIIEDVAGEQIETPGKLLPHTRYEYSCRVFLKNTPRELLGLDVCIPDSRGLMSLLDPEPRIPVLIGELSGAAEHIPVVLKGESLLDTHSCIFGSSGSGKTTLLGLLMEEILLNIPDAQIVVLDLNSDFVRFDEIVPVDEVNASNNKCQNLDSDALTKQQMALAAAPKKLISAPNISMRRLAPCDLLETHGILCSPGSELLLTTLQESLRQAGYTFSPEGCEQFLRGSLTKRDKWFRNFHEKLTSLIPSRDERDRSVATIMGIMARIKKRPIWSSTNNDSISELDKSDHRRFIEFNLGGLPFADRAVLAEGVLMTLWDRNEHKKRHTFIVVDEGYNVAPALPEETWQKTTLEWVNRISGEGRKYGLYLILVSQRPAKIHPTTVDNCRNFFILRLQNQTDLEYLSKSTLEVSGSLLSRAGAFRRHEALIFGDIGVPAIIRTGRRRLR